MKLDTLISLKTHNPLTIQENGFDKECDHSYSKESIKQYDDHSKATCLKCKGHLTIEIYD